MQLFSCPTSETSDSVQRVDMLRYLSSCTALNYLPPSHPWFKMPGGNFTSVRCLLRQFSHLPADLGAPGHGPSVLYRKNINPAFCCSEFGLKLSLIFPDFMTKLDEYIESRKENVIIFFQVCTM